MKQLISFLYPSGDFVLDVKRKSPSIIWFLSNIFSVRRVAYIDRFGVFDSNDYEWYNYPMFESFEEIKSQKKMTFEECCYIRTNDLISYANLIDKDIYVAWSGGVDSTTIIVSFLMNDRLDKSRFHVLYNKHSIEEYPYFYELLKKNNILMCDCLYELNLLDTQQGDNLIIDGTCGDKMESNSTVDILKYYNFNDTSWKDSCIKICDILSYNDKDYYIDRLEKYINYFKLPITSFKELAWLLEFGCEWRRTTELRKLISCYPERRISFFDTTYFSKYALDRYQNINQEYCSKGSKYKEVFKKIIYKYTKDDEYFLNKGKEIHPWFYLDGNLYLKDNEGYHSYKINNESHFLSIMLPYFKEEYREYISTVKTR